MSSNQYPAPIIQKIEFKHPHFYAEIELTKINESDTEEDVYCYMTNDPTRVNESTILVSGPMGSMRLMLDVEKWAGKKNKLHHYDNAMMLLDTYARLDLVDIHIKTLEKILAHHVEKGILKKEREEIVKQAIEVIQVSSSALGFDRIEKDYIDYLNSQLDIVERIYEVSRIDQVKTLRCRDIEGMRLHIDTEETDDKFTLIISNVQDNKSLLPIPYFYIEANKEGFTVGNHQGPARFNEPRAVLSYLRTHVDSIKFQSLGLDVSEETNEQLQKAHALWMWFYNRGSEIEGSVEMLQMWKFLDMKDFLDIWIRMTAHELAKTMEIH